MPAVPELTRLVGNPDAKVVSRAVTALGAIPCIQSTVVLHRILDEQRDPETLRVALVASPTVEVGKQLLVPPIVKALHHPDSGIREMAAWALGRMGNAGTFVVPSLVKSLNDPDPAVRGHAAVALATFRASDRLSVMPLAQCVGDKDAGVRRDCAAALGSFGKKARLAIPMLKKAAEDSESSVRSAASYALFRIDRARD